MPLPFLIGGLAAIGSALAGAGAAAAGVAAAGAAAVGGAAAAVGGAAAAGAAAVGGAAAAAGTAIASSAVGSAAIGAMSAVGGAVGTAAAAASSVPVIGAAAGTISTIATGTAAGAAAVGTVATTGVIGAATGISGAAKLSEASDIKDEALASYRSEKRHFEAVQEETNSMLKSLGEDKLKIWESFERFSVMYSKIKNPPVMDGAVKEESLSLDPDELDHIRAVAASAKDILSGGITGIAAGGLVSCATLGGVAGTVFASTGTAISTLSGAAATNATLAALGGGSLAAGGAGMAGGVAVLGGLTVAPMLMVGGIMLNSKGSQALETANDIKRESRRAVEKMEDSEIELNKVRILAEKIQKELKILNTFYGRFMERMEDIVLQKTDYRKFSYEEKRTLEKTVLSLKLLKQLSMQNILDPEHQNTVLTSEVDQTLQASVTAREEKLGMEYAS